jgi:hypothetical protein
MRTFARKKQPMLAYVLGFGFVALAGQANASCLSGITEGMLPDKSPTPSAKPSAPAPAAISLVQAVYRPGQASAPKLLPAGDWNDNDGDEPIVGLWQFVLNGGMDFGTQAWHADGTELMLSAARDPAAGDVCQGAWRKVGNRTYTLNHIAMGWDAGYGPGKPLIRVHLHMVVKVDRSGKSFTGTVSGVACMETDLSQPFLESKDNCQPLPPDGSIVGTWVKPD